MKSISITIKISNKIEDIGLYHYNNGDNIYFKELHEIQSQSKQYIHQCHNWNELKKKNENNLYNKKKDSNNIIKLDICSRSYLKLIEICQDNNLCNDKKINYLALAEAPGGFIEAFMAIRRKKFLGRNDNIVTISLRNKNYEVPQYIFKNKHNFNINIFYGVKGNGDLFDIDNILSIGSVLNEKYNLVTADGGIDFSQDYNNQEEQIYRLLFTETISAFIYLEKDGNFILKIFDIMTYSTIELIYFISSYFEEVTIVKPYLSRLSNSEKYLVCKKFRGIDNEIINKLLLIYKILYIDKTDIKYKIIKSIPLVYINKIYKYSKNIISNQIKNILKIILEINNIDNILYNFNWCKKYDINSYK